MPLVWIGVLPFFAYATLFLLLPTGALLVGAFKNDAGHWTWREVHNLFQGQYVSAYKTSIELSLLTAALGGIFGFLLAYSAVSRGVPRWIRPVLNTFSGVAANFGGIPLAFAWISTLGTLGVVTKFFRDQLGYDLYQNGFTLFSFTGLSIVYLYFQIPLMVLVIAPAIDGLKREWREAAANLGASWWQYWWRVALPVLAPSLLGTTILLFGNAFAAYATAYSLTSGKVNVVPLLIGQVMTGNVLSDIHQGYALAFGMVVVIAASMVGYALLMRRASRWTRR